MTPQDRFYTAYDKHWTDEEPLEVKGGDKRHYHTIASALAVILFATFFIVVLP